MQYDGSGAALPGRPERQNAHGGQSAGPFRADGSGSGERSSNFTVVVIGRDHCRVPLPPRDAVDDTLRVENIQLASIFDLDLGELVEGRRVIARGISRGRTAWIPVREDLENLPKRRVVVNGIELEALDGEPRRYLAELEDELHYEVVPSLAEGERLDHWWMEVTDDLGTTYNDNQTGAYGLAYGGSATIGSRDLGGRVPEAAAWLEIRFRPGGRPQGRWCAQLDVDLEGDAVVSRWGHGPGSP